MGIAVTMGQQDFIRFENLTLGYERHPAIHHLTASIPRGALLAIAGPNGAGKSTLLKGLAGQLRPLEGRFHLDAAAAKIAYMPQRAEIDLTFPVSVFETVAMGLWHEIGAFGQVGPHHVARIEEALARVGLTGFESRQIGSVSGGQLQRAMFARLMLQNAALVLLDEPFAGVDYRTIHDLIGIVQGWHAEGCTVLVVLHDLDLIRRVFPECMLLAREMVGYGPSPEILTEAYLGRARRLSEAFDDNASDCVRVS